MLFRIVRFVAIVLSLAVIQGCVTKQSLPDLPATLGNKGLLVARIHVLGMSAMADAQVNIDGKLIPSGMRDGYVAIPVEPGDHKLIQLRVMGRLLSSNLVEENSPIRKVKGGGGGAPTYIYTPGGSYTINYTNLGVDRSFRIEAGKVTNLGLIVYLPVLEDPNKKRATVNESRDFNVFALDNSAEVNRFLDINYPELVGNLKNRDILLAPTNYLDGTRLPILRRAIAYFESRGNHVIGDSARTIIYGKAGTIAVLNKPVQGEKSSPPAEVEILDSGTLADIVGAARNGQQFNFLTSDGKLLSWESGKLAETALPFKVHPVGLNSLGSTGLVAVDNRLRIMTSRYLGDTWASYEGAMVRNPRSDVNIVSDGDGAYISLGYRGLPESIYYVEPGASKPKSIPSPENRSGISNQEFNTLVARDAGLFMMFSKADFFFWSKARQTWSIHSMPRGKCKPLTFDSKGENLKVECDGMVYSSSDSGLTWEKPSI